MRPSGVTAVASMVSNAAPDRARWPRWMTCQSVMQPSTAEYWHIGAMTMRLANSRAPTRSGVNSALMSLVELLVAAEDAFLVERNPSIRGEIGGNARPRHDTVVQCDKTRNPTLEPFHAVGKRVTQACDDLEQRQVHVADTAAEDIVASALVQQAFEIAEKFRDPMFPECGGTFLGDRTLLLVVERARHRMMRIVDLRQEICDGKLELVRPQPTGLVARAQGEARTEPQQDVGALRNDEVAGLEERRRKRRTLGAAIIDDLHHGGDAALALPRHVDVVDPALLEREAHEFAAALDGRPIVELVAHRAPPRSALLHPRASRRDRPLQRKHSGIVDRMQHHRGQEHPGMLIDQRRANAHHEDRGGRGRRMNDGEDGGAGDGRDDDSV